MRSGCFRDFSNGLPKRVDCTVTACVRRLNRARMELSCSRPMQQAKSIWQHLDAGFPWTTRYMQERTASNPRLKATNDDLFISGRDLMTVWKGQQNELRIWRSRSWTEDQEYDAITILWTEGHKYAFFKCYWWLKDGFHCHGIKKQIENNLVEKTNLQTGSPYGLFQELLSNS